MKKTILLFSLSMILLSCAEDKKPLQFKANPELSEKLKSDFKFEKDKFKNIEFITHKNIKSGIYPYIIKIDSSSYVLKIAGQKEIDSDYLHDKILLNIDGQNVEMKLGNQDINAEGKHIVEFDEIVNTDTYQILKQISGAKKIDIRWSSFKNNYIDEEMKTSEIKAIKETLEYYQSLGATIN